MIKKGDHILITGLGLEFALIMCAGYFGGRRADRYFDSSPLFLLICSALAFLAGVYILVKTANMLARREAAAQKNAEAKK